MKCLIVIEERKMLLSMGRADTSAFGCTAWYALKGPPCTGRPPIYAGGVRRVLSNDLSIIFRALA